MQSAGRVVSAGLGLGPAGAAGGRAACTPMGNSVSTPQRARLTPSPRTPFLAFPRRHTQTHLPMLR